MERIKTHLEWLDIGCGNLLHEWCIWIDLDPHSQASVICNIDEWIPFDDNSFSFVFAHNIIEHSKNLVFVMEEVARVCKNDALVEIIVPHYSSRYAWWDLTHIRPFSYSSFDGYDGKSKNLKLIDKQFQFISANNKTLAIILQAFLVIPVVLSRLFPRFFERFLCYSFWWIDYIKFTFQVVK